jgi:hypothetical protein
MPPAGFETAMAASERQQTDGLFSVATGIGYCISCGYKFHSLIIKAEKS